MRNSVFYLTNEHCFMLHLESFCEGHLMKENSILNIQSRETSTLTQIMYVARTCASSYNCL
jgi:hypothetical protein